MTEQLNQLRNPSPSGRFETVPDTGREHPGSASSGHLLGGASFGIRRGEGKFAWTFFLYFLLLATCHYAGKSVRQATYIDALGADRLPYVYLLVALTSFPVLVLYSRLTSRFRDDRLITAFCLIQAAGMVLFFWLYSLDQAWVALAYYVWMTIAFGIAVSQLWGYANQIFDARQARRLFAVIGAGGLLGGIPGGQIARLVAAHLSTRHTLLASAILMLLIIILVRIIEGLRSDRETAPGSEPSPVPIAEAHGGLQVLRSSRLLLLIAGLMLLTVVVAQMVDLQFNWAIEHATEHLDQRTEVYGNFFSFMGLFAFIFQLVFTQRIHRILGVGFGMRVLPATVALGTGGLILSVGLLPASLLAAAWFLKMSEAGLRHSLDQATRELLFLPVPAQLRRQAKAYIDVFVQRFAKGVAAVVLLTVTFGLLTVLQVSWLTLLLTAIWIWVTVAVRREYVRTFRDGLKSDSAEDSAAIDPGDLTTVTTLVELLGSGDARQVLHSLELLGAHGHGRLIPPLLLYHDDPRVRRKTLHILADENRTDAIGLVEKLIGDDEPEVRTAAIETLALLQGEDSQALMLPRLADSDLRLRSAAIVSLMGARDPHVSARADAALTEMLSAADPGLRSAAAHTLGQIREPEGFESLVQLLYDSDLTVVREAIAAVRQRLARDGPNLLYHPILISLMRNRRLKHDAREALVAYGDSGIEALIHFMRSPDEQTWVQRAIPKTVAILADTHAAEALLRSLDTPDAFLHRKLIEALVYIRHRAPEVSFRNDIVRRELHNEVERYLRAMADLWSISSMYEVFLNGPHAGWRIGGQVPTLLQQLLANRMSVTVQNIFGLLQLLFRPVDVRAAYRSLISGQAFLRARALEYLDNTLTGTVRRDVFAVIDDSAPDEKLRLAENHFGIRPQLPDETLRRIICSDIREDSYATSLVLGALYSVYTEQLTSFYPLVRTLAEQEDEPLVRETAQWLLRKVETAPAPYIDHPLEPASIEKGGEMEPGTSRESATATMARIEMVVFLQSVELFSYCNAEQMVRLVGIAREVNVRKGDIIFRRNDPPEALYCVVEGSVALEGTRSGRTSAGPRDTFGVTDIMGGQLRSFDATAALDSRLLAIEAEDFFDLLSNNIEIVKALFRRLTQMVLG